MKAPCILEFEDRGQDFTRWSLDKENMVIDAQPFQSWVWNGCRVLNRSFRLGDQVRFLYPDGVTEGTLRYRIVDVRRRAA